MYYVFKPDCSQYRPVVKACVVWAKAGLPFKKAQKHLSKQ